MVSNKIEIRNWILLRHDLLSILINKKYYRRKYFPGINVVSEEVTGAPKQIIDLPTSREEWQTDSVYKDIRDIIEGSEYKIQVFILFN